MNERECETGWRRYLMWPVKPTEPERRFYAWGFEKGMLVGVAWLITTREIARWWFGY